MLSNRIEIFICGIVSLLLLGSKNEATHYNESKNFIVGGITARSPIPYQVSLQSFSSREKQWSHFCGGAIITSYHVITAAHCLHKRQPSQVSVVAGTLRRSVGGIRHHVQWIRSHPEYREFVQNDVAIIRVRIEFTWGNHIRPIEFRSNRFVGGGVACQISGWGFINQNLPLPENLQTLSVRTISDAQCRQTFDTGPTQICAEAGLHRGACYADSGGPLVNMERTLLIGIVSFGPKTCGTRSPDVYARISSLVSWISNEIQR